MTHLKFPSLEQFNNVFRHETRKDAPRAVTYGAKIKLHGTNLGLRIAPDGAVTLQSRKHDLVDGREMDQAVEFLMPQAAIWATAALCQTLTFYGEWAGPGIARGDAVQQTDAKRFYIFALGVGAAPHHQDSDKTVSTWMITDPDAIRSALPDGIDTDRIRVLPWMAKYHFDFSDETQVNGELDRLNAAVEDLDRADPYIEQVFGISRPGEGYVLMHKADAVGMLSSESFARTSFKAKTEKHRVRKQGKPASPREPLPADAHALIDTYVTEARLCQALEESCGGEADKRKTGAFVAWMVGDVLKEAADDIAELGIDPIRLKGPIAEASRPWFFARAAALV